MRKQNPLVKTDSWPLVDSDEIFTARHCIVLVDESAIILGHVFVKIVREYFFVRREHKSGCSSLIIVYTSRAIIGCYCYLFLAKRCILVCMPLAR